MGTMIMHNAYCTIPELYHKQHNMMDVLNQVKSLLIQTLQLGSRGAGLDASSPLLGAIPELDSMAVVRLLTVIEEHFGFVIDDDEISAESFATLSSLVDFVEHKLAR